MAHSTIKKALLKAAMLSMVCIGFCLPSVSAVADDDRVIIYSSAEEYRNEYYAKRLKETFPQYNIVIDYMPSGNQAARLKAEGLKTMCDISLDLEYSQYEMLNPILAPVEKYDRSIFTDDYLDPPLNCLPGVRNGGAVIVNTEVLKEKGLPEPLCYDDLLRPEFADLVSMPNPKTSGTGYMFLRSLTNAWGEEKAFAFFEKLSENVLQFTSSGSGPVKALVQGEAAVGLGMTAQAVTEINKGAPLKILFFKEGSPFSKYGCAVIKGKEQRKCVADVFDFFYSDLLVENNERFYPERIFKDKAPVIKNYPSNIPYSDMSRDTIEEKIRLLEMWDF